MNLFMCHDEETGGLIAADHMGFIKDRREMQIIINELTKFYNNSTMTDLDIRKHNHDLLGEQNREYDDMVIRTREKPKREKKQGVVYFMQADNGLVKIGETKNLATRFAAISGGLLNELKLLCHIKSDDVIELEKQYHERYESKRVKGEWFDLSDNDIKVIKGEVKRGTQSE